MIKKIEKKDDSEAFKTIGKKISDRRKSLRKKFPGISKKLNISVNFLKYIEEGKLDKIPDHIPAKGFVKSYAKLLNVDIEDELDIIEQDVNTIDHRNDSKKSIIKRTTQAYFFYILLCVVFLISVIYFLNSNDKNSIDNFYGLKNKYHFTDNKKYNS